MIFLCTERRIAALLEISVAGGAASAAVVVDALSLSMPRTLAGPDGGHHRFSVFAEKQMMPEKSR